MGRIKRSSDDELVCYSRSELFRGQAAPVPSDSQKRCKQASACRLNEAELKRTRCEDNGIAEWRHRIATKVYREPGRNWIKRKTFALSRLASKLDNLVSTGCRPGVERGKVC